MCAASDKPGVERQSHLKNRAARPSPGHISTANAYLNIINRVNISNIIHFPLTIAASGAFESCGQPDCEHGWTGGTFAAAVAEPGRQHHHAHPNTHQVRCISFIPCSCHLIRIGHAFPLIRCPIRGVKLFQIASITHSSQKAWCAPHIATGAESAGGSARH